VQIGVVFPQTEIGPDPGPIRAYAEAVAELGYRHLLTYEHVVGADPAVYQGWSGPYDLHSTFHEPLVLFGFLAAISNLELVTGILIAPQRQTVLVAKQAAEVDLLSGGRLRLGVGIGWNHVEYDALGEDFATRGRRLEEQVGLLRRLWTEESVTSTGRFDHVTGAGLAPLPTQRPIPIWFGGTSDRALRRAGRLGDGWFPQVSPGAGLEEALEVLGEGAAEAGRDPATIAMEGRIQAGDRDLERIGQQAEQWRSAGASHLSLNTMGAGLEDLDDHIASLAAAAEVVLGP
jgi:probable F420-dependent oxidoreductase